MEASEPACARAEEASAACAHSPSVVVGARHLGTGAKIIALISHVLVEQQTPKPLSSEADASIDVLKTAFAITAGQVSTTNSLGNKKVLLFVDNVYFRWILWCTA